MLPRFLGQSSFSQWSSVESHSATVLGRRSLGQAYSAKVTRPGPLVLGHAYSAKVTSSSFGPGCLGGPFSFGQGHSAKSTRTRPCLLGQSDQHLTRTRMSRRTILSRPSLFGQDHLVISVALGQGHSAKDKFIRPSSRTRPG